MTDKRVIRMLATVAGFAAAGCAGATVELQAAITEKEVGELLAARRDDLPGRPPVHETALRTLVEHLVR